MQFQVNSWTIFLSLALLQGLFLSAGLTSWRGGNRRANRLMALLVLLLSIHIAECVMRSSYFYLDFPQAYLATYSLLFTYGPLLYLFTHVLTRDRFPRFSQSLLHFIPAVFCAYYLVDFFQLAPEGKMDIIVRDLSAGGIYAGSLQDNIHIIACLHILIYLLLACYRLYQYRLELRTNCAYHSGIDYHWLRKTLETIILLFIAVFFLQYFYRSAWPETMPVIFLFLASLAIPVYLLGYMLMHKPEVNIRLVVGTERKRSGLMQPSWSDADQRSARERLIQLMEDQKPYLQRDLRLPYLAELLEMQPQHLAELIHESFSLNFYDFINRYRILEAQKRLRIDAGNRYANHNLIFDVGFMTKAAFRSAFRKHCGMPPAQFRKLLREQQPLQQLTPLAEQNLK